MCLRKKTSGRQPPLVCVELPLSGILRCLVWNVSLSPAKSLRKPPGTMIAPSHSRPVDSCDAHDELGNRCAEIFVQPKVNVRWNCSPFTLGKR